MNKLYTEPELRKILGISRTTVYRLRKLGLLKTVRLGRSIRFTQEQVDDLLKGVAELKTDNKQNTEEQLAA